VTAPLLQLEQLGVRYPVGHGWRKRELVALRGMTLSLDRGEIVAIVGESGSGKSTLARLVTRQERPSGGRILLDGEDVLRTQPRGPTRDYRRRVQLVFQDPFASLNPAHTVLHHLVRPLVLHKRATRARERGIALLDQVGLRPGGEFIDRRPHELSGGQRQRVAIARALAPEPDLLFADEPTSMLDVSIRMGVLQLLEDLRQQRGLAIVMITHDLAAARWLADRIVVVYGGRLMEEASADDIARRPAHPYSRLLVEAAPRPGADITAPLPARPGRAQTVDPPPGCPFAPRCPKVQDRCRSEDPPIQQLGDRTRVACFHPETP
jgi:peptide/nickel transport system ATP-binding protein